MVETCYSWLFIMCFSHLYVVRFGTFGYHQELHLGPLPFIKKTGSKQEEKWFRKIRSSLICFEKAKSLFEAFIFYNEALLVANTKKQLYMDILNQYRLDLYSLETSKFAARGLPHKEFSFHLQYFFFNVTTVANVRTHLLIVYWQILIQKVIDDVMHNFWQEFTFEEMREI